MSQSVLEQLSDFGDFAGNKELGEVLKAQKGEQRKRLSNVRLSPDGRHVHVILCKPKVGLVTFDKYERPQLAQSQKKLELCLTRTEAIVDVLYLDSSSSSSRDSLCVAVVCENGKVEFWKFQECSGGWHLLQTSDLCNSPRARVVSVCVCSNLIIWCEERPPSESSSSQGSTRNKLRFCVCRRDYEVEEAAVSLGGVRIALHNNPKFTVVGAGDYVHLLPDTKTKLSISKFFLSWYPRHDSFSVNTTCRSTPLKKLSAKESDFRRLVTDCLGYLSSLEPPEIYDFSPSACGGLLLLLCTGWLCLLQKDGMLRRVYKLADNCTARHGTHTGLCVFQDTVALLVGQTLYLIDLNCGRELEKIPLRGDGLLFQKRAEGHTPHLLSENGLFAVVQQEADGSGRDFNARAKPAESVHPGAILVEAVFEEACKYYQQRSLSSTQLTVDALKRGGRFQAPISLASILRNYLSGGSKQRAADSGGGGGCVAGHDKLSGSLEAELKALVALEDLKGSLVRGSAKEVETVCESLVEKEVGRLLSTPELDKEGLLYLNSIFTVFPCQAWRAAQSALQLHYNGEGSLSSRAPPDVWKSVLSPPSAVSFSASVPLTNGRPKHKQDSLRGDHGANCKSKPPSCTPAAPLPVFELLCHSVLDFQSSWLPRFLELAQQQQCSAGLGLSLASSSWSFSGTRGGEGADNNVPLYKRALGILSSLKADKNQELEVELLMVSGRPNAILQALRVLIAKQEWERVTQVAQRFCKQSPLLNKEIFTTLLCEVTQHRDLDPYLELLWSLCPEDLTVTTILNLVLKNLPSPNSTSPTPFADPQSAQLTIGLLKPLLRKVLQRETKPSQHYADILQSPSFPPPAPPRQPTEPTRTVTDSPLGDDVAAAPPEAPPSTNVTVQSSRMALPPNPL